jgi:hypothetical protein
MKPSIDMSTRASPSDLASEPQRALEPPRLLAGSGSPLERRLLESAGVDRMPAASRLQLTRALAGAGAPLAVRLVGWLSVSHVVKYAALAGLGTLALLGGWVALERPALSPLEPVARLPAPAGLLPSPAREPAAPPPAANAIASAIDMPPSASAARDVSRPTPPRRAAPKRRTSAAIPAPAEMGLGAELHLLESAQTALRAGRDDDAQRALDEHARRFPAGELALEAEVLGIELSFSRGEHARAQARARSLLLRPAAASYRHRLEALERVRGGANKPTSSGANPSSSHMEERR